MPSSEYLDMVLGESVDKPVINKAENPFLKDVLGEPPVPVQNEVTEPVTDSENISKPKTVWKTIEKPKEFFNRKGAIVPGMSSVMSRMGLGPQPEGGYSEAGVPLDKEGKSYYEAPEVQSKVGKIAADTLSGLTSLATHPYEIIRGGMDVALSMPGFITGIGSAASFAAKEMFDQVILGGTFNLDNIYSAASKGMEQSMEFFQPAKDFIMKPPSEESQLAGQVMMAPITGFSILGHKVAEWKGFEDYPNIKGAAKFAGDIAGLAAMGMIMHGKGSRANFTKDIESVIKEADKIIVEEQAIAGIPNVLVQQIQSKILDTKKKQLEVKAEEIAKRTGEDALIREEIGRQVERIAQERSRPVQETGLDIKVDARTKEIKKLREAKVEPTPLEKTVEEVLGKPEQTFDNTIVEAEAKGLGVGIKFQGTQEGFGKIPGAQLFNIMDGPAKGATIAFRDTMTKSEINNKIQETVRLFSEKPTEPITKLDESIGVEIPGLEGEQSPFFQSSEEATTFNKLYSERAKAVAEDPELFTQKLINDVNKWYHGDESVDIVKVRDGLSNLTTKADELREFFLTGADHFEWKETVSEAASWARRIDRSKIKPSVEESKVPSKKAPSKKVSKETKIDYFGEGDGTQLNMMIPIEEIPKAVRWIWNEVKDSIRPISDLYRNKELFRDTGYWLGQDGLWRYELSDRGMKFTDRFSASPNQRMKLSNAIEHPTLFEAFPDAKDVIIKSTDKLGKYEATYNPATNTIEIGNELNIRHVAHELQHSINENIGAFTGTNLDYTKGDIKEYKSNPGEMESRVVEARFKMSDFERNAIAPWETLDKMLEKEGIGKSEGFKLYSGLPIDEVGNVIKLVTKPVREFAKKLNEDIKHRVEQTLEKVKAYDKWQWDEGDRVKSNKTGKVYTITARGWNNKDNKPIYFYENLLDQEKGTFIAEKAHDTLIHMSGPKGTTLYSGLPIDKIIESVKSLFGTVKDKTINVSKFPKDQQEIVQRALNYKKAFIRDTEASARKQKMSVTELKNIVAESVWDTKSYARKLLLKGQREGKLGIEANRALQKMVNEAGGHAYGQTLFSQFLKEVYGGIDSNSTRILNQLVRGKRIQDIANYKPGTKFPKDQSFEDTIAYEYIFEGIEGISNKAAAKLLTRRDAYFEWMSKLVDELEIEGIVSKEKADGLRSHNYAKFRGIGQRLENGKGGSIDLLFDEKYETKLGGKLRSVTSSGIDSLAKGKKTDILEADQRITALEMFNRVYGRIFTNRTFKELAEVARRQPDNGFVKLGKKEATEGQSGIMDSRGMVRHFFWENGEKKVIYLEPAFADGLTIAGRDISPRAITWLKNATLSGVAKTMLTGTSSLWSLFVNLPRDIAHTYMATGTYEQGKFKPIYSSIPPVFATQLGADYARTFYDTFFRSYKQSERTKFMRSSERGLLMPFMSTQARLSKKGYKLPSEWSKVEDIFTYFPESLELWTRQSIVERVVGNEAKVRGISREEARANNEVMDKAVFTARDYLDFSQGGWFTKMMDQAGMIYLNAGTQAGRTFFRPFKENPTQAILRTVQAIGIPTVMITLASKLYSPKTSESIPKYQDDTNMNIPFPDSFIFEDASGQETGIYLSIPMDSGAAFLKNVFQGLTEKMMFNSGLSGEEPNYESIVSSLTRTAPDIVSLPPTVRGTFEYMLNKSFWTHKDITPKTFPYPQSSQEFTKGRTSELAIDVGQVTGLSPDRLEAVRRDILGNNEWTYVVGKGYDTAFGDVPKEMKEEHLALILAEVPGIKRFIKTSKIGSSRLDKQDKIITEAEFESFVDSRNVDFYAKAHHWYGAEGADKELRNYLRRSDIRKDPDKWERLNNRAEFIRSVKDLPERNTWLKLWYKSAEVKVKDYVDRQESARTKEDKAKLRKQMGVVLGAKGYAGDKFWEEVGKVKRQ